VAKILTPEQREAKRQRDAEYRARKKAAAQPVAATEPIVVKETEPVTPTVEPTDVLSAKLGDQVTTPVLGAVGFVAKTFRNARLVTEDGEHMWASTCPHSTDERENKGTVIWFEQVGTSKDFADKTTGQVHRFSRCNKVITA
jgi:hypothetical protein